MLNADERTKLADLEHRAAMSLKIAERAESKGSFATAERMLTLAAKTDAEAAVLRAKEARLLATRAAFDRANAAS